MYRLNSASVISVSEMIGRISALKLVNSTPEPLALRALRREDRDLDREDQDQQDPQQERGHRVEHGGEPVEEVIDELVPAHRLDHADRDGQQQGQDGGDADQEDGLGQVRGPAARPRSGSASRRSRGSRSAGAAATASTGCTRAGRTRTAGRTGGSRRDCGTSSGPRTAMAGLPGIARSRANVITVTSRSTTIDCSTLRSRNIVTNSPLRAVWRGGAGCEPSTPASGSGDLVRSPC